LRRRQTADVPGHFFATDVPAFCGSSDAIFLYLTQYISRIYQVTAAALLGIR
jgi:hypothetical protein